MTEEKSIYEQMSDRIMTSGSKIIPQLFEFIANEDEAKLMMATPGTVDELSEKTDKDKETTQKMLDELFHKGLIFKSKKETGTIYRMCRDLVQFHDATILWQEAPKEYQDLWLKYMNEEWPAYAKIVEQVIKDPFTRIVPIGESITPESKVEAIDDVMTILDNARRFAVTNCTCRTIDGKCGKDLEVCLQVDRSADYSIERGTGRELTRDEAKAIVRKADDDGLVHVIMNSKSKQNFICNCCSDCCQVLPVFINEGIKTVSPSRFSAKVDANLCTGCESCIERCVFGALSMTDDLNAVVDPEKCMGCGLCVAVCPAEAITLYETRETESIPA